MLGRVGPATFRSWSKPPTRTSRHFFWSLPIPWRYRKSTRENFRPSLALAPATRSVHTFSSARTWCPNSKKKKTQSTNNQIQSDCDGTVMYVFFHICIQDSRIPDITATQCDADAMEPSVLPVAPKKKPPRIGGATS